MDEHGISALIAKRTDNPPVETEEIRALTSAAGYDVAGELTQVRSEDPGTHLGAGKVSELADRVAEDGIQLVVVDEELTPQQTKQLRDELPDDTKVYDRYRLILEIFDEQASTQRAKLQMELAQLKYELPRIDAATDAQMMTVMSESTAADNVRDRIHALERKIDELPSPAEKFREERREQGFDLVTLAGYTNAGKSTLLHRLGDDMSLSEAEPDHPDRDKPNAIEDRLFKTLETTTRRTTFNGRPVLMTDTVGFVQDVPHWLISSFSETLSEAAAADVVVLVVDASDPPDDVRDKFSVSLDVLNEQGVENDSIVTVLNKVDLLNEDERQQRIEIVSDVSTTVVPVSITEGTNMTELVDAIYEQLPTARANLSMPNCSDAMAVVSWMHDETAVESVEYRSDTIEVTLEGRPAVVEQARAKANDVIR